jgi:hypothetical protein
MNLKMRFLLGQPIKLTGIGTLNPVTINGICEIGADQYNKYLGLLCISKADIQESLNTDDDENPAIDIEPFDFIYVNSVNDGEFMDMTINALELIFGEVITFYPTEACFGIGEDVKECRMLHKGNYNFVADIIRMQNCINNKSEDTKNQSKAVRDYNKKLKEVKAKQSNDSSGIIDIVSAVCSKHPSVNIFNVGGMTIYQLVDQYKRLNMIDDYYISIESLMHGASQDEVKPVHWSSKLVEEQQEVISNTVDGNKTITIG